MFAHTNPGENMPQALPTDEISARAWAFELLTDIFNITAETVDTTIGAASRVSDYILSGVTLSERTDLHRRLVGNPAAIDGLRDLIKKVEHRLLIQRVDPDSLAGADTRVDFQYIVNLFDQIFPSVGHDQSPVSGLDTETVAGAGGAVTGASGEGR